MRAVATVLEKQDSGELFLIWRAEDVDFDDGAALRLDLRHDLDGVTPFNKLTQEQQNILLYGSGKDKITFEYQQQEDNHRWVHKNEFEGVINNLRRRYRETKSEYIRSEIQKYMTVNNCSVCNGKRLRPESLMVKIAGYSIADLSDMTIGKLV
ncbi:MAG: hypothetical protein R6V12_09190, partial [Candidatus Hydrogenedentota bacterium]